MKFTAAPGIYIVEPLKDVQSAVTTSQESKVRVMHGKVIATSPDNTTVFGVKIPSPVKVGDHAYFLSYEGAYDQFKYEGKTYYTVKFDDHRGVMI